MWAYFVGLGVPLYLAGIYIAKDFIDTGHKDDDLFLVAFWPVVVAVLIVFGPPVVAFKMLGLGDGNEQSGKSEQSTLEGENEQTKN